MAEWTNRRILDTALVQSAVDVGCIPEDFLKTEPAVVLFWIDSRAWGHLEPAFSVLNGALEDLALRVCFMAEHFLPDLCALRPLDCPYSMKLLGPEDSRPPYLLERGIALGEKSWICWAWVPPCLGRAGRQEQRTQGKAEPGRGLSHSPTY